ncbi:MAG: SRPBCC domain-containing protein [Pseudomonadota bacterium]
MNLFRILILSAMVVSGTVHSEVLDKSAGGFVIEIKGEVEQSVEESYQQFLRVSEWWDGDHSWFGSANNFYIEPRVGGCFCEIEGDKQAHHMMVSFIEPNKEVRMLGGLGPLQMMGVNGAMSWQFDEAGDGLTLITHRYTVTGYHKDGLDKLAPIVDQVQSGQVQRLIDRLGDANE